MGAVCSNSVAVEDAAKVVAASENYEANSAIDAKIIKILQSKKKERENFPAKYKNFDRIILKFGMIERAFLGLKTIYTKYKDVETDGVRYQDLKAILSELKVEMEESDIKDIFTESDMRRDESLDFNEFVVSLAIGYLLGSIPELEEDGGATETEKEDAPSRTMSSSLGNRLELSAAFNVVVDAYLMFDEDASGTINFEEIDAVLSKGSSNEGSKEMNSKAAPSFLSKERWSELDWDNNGTITFQEFLLAFEGWIGIDADEDE